MTDREVAHHACTPKQIQIYDLHDRGMSRRAIALALDLSPSTVQTHLENARRNIARYRRSHAG